MVKSRLTLLAVSLILAVVLAEIGLRIWRPVPDDQLLPFPYDTSRVRRIANDDTYLRFDRDLGWSLPPSHTRREDGLVFRTNRATMRADREYDLETPPGRLRIAAFGDSFTHCSEVTQKDCWTSRLEASWPNTEVLNFGVTAYGPDQAWLRYQRDGRPYRPCTVLIGYFVEDIDRVVNRFRPFMHPGDSVMMSKPRFVLDGPGLRLIPNPATDPRQLGDAQWVEQTLGPDDTWYFPGTYVKGPLDDSRLVRLARTAAYQRSRTALVRSERAYPLYDPAGEAYQVTGRILIEFAEQVRADGAAPVVVVFPGRRDLAANAEGIRPYAPLVSWLMQAGVTTLDLTDLMAGEADRHGLSRLFEERHYSPLGNRAVAAHLAETLPGLVPSTCHSD